MMLVDEKEDRLYIASLFTCTSCPTPRARWCTDGDRLLPTHTPCTHLPHLPTMTCTSVPSPASPALNTSRDHLPLTHTPLIHTP